MKTLHHILIAFAAIAVAEMILYWVISSNLEAGVYPVEADSIGIPLFSSLIFAVASLILIVLAILCQLGPKWLNLLGVLLFLASAAITGFFAFSWASPNHYLISRPCKTSATRMNIGFAPVLLGARFPENLRIRF
jgi:hypothetical protein